MSSASKNTLKERNSKPSENEPSISPIYIRGHVRNNVRYCLIGGKNLKDTIASVQKSESMYNKEIKALIEHFFYWEIEK